MRRVAALISLLAFSTWFPGVPPAVAADVSVPAAAETTPVPSSSDAADDTAIWIHPSDPSQSAVIGTDKLSTGGIGVYDLAGRQLHFYLHGSMNNVDLRYNFPLGSERVALVGVTDRNDTSTGVRFYKVNPGDRSLTTVGRISTPGRPRGFAMYHSAVSGKYYAFVHDFHTNVIYQYELDGSTGSVTGQEVRSFDNGNSSEGIVADDELGYVYVAEEETAVWKYGAEPNAGSTRTAVDYATISGGRIIDNIKNPTIYYGRNGTGYLIVSSQGGSNFMVYERAGSNAFVGSFKINQGPSGVDGVNGQDGIDVTNFGLGTAFPGGLFTSQDHNNTDAGNGNSGNQNHKLVSWETIAKSFTPNLLIDTQWDPRLVGGDGGNPPPPDETAPETVVESGPEGATGATSATFTFAATEPATFECRLDDSAFEPCSSPKEYTGLVAGAHTFAVRATDTAGNVDETPAARTWTVDPNASATLIFAPEADAAVEAASPATNFGGAATLSADSSPQEESYVRFDLSGLSGTVAGATLRVYATNGSTNGPSVYGTGSSWEENVITWGSGRPARTTGVLGDQGAVASGTWMEFDVTSYVTTNGPVSFNIAPTSSDGTDMSSRESGGNRPQLVVTTSGSTPPPDDTLPPETSIGSGPSGTTSATSATFAFTADEPATFECRLDDSAFEPCSSPKEYTGLVAGAHTFAVRATDTAGNVDETPATRTWTVEAGGGTPGTSTFVAEADAAVEAASPSTNFGAATTLRADTSPQEESYVRFDVSGLSGTVDQAKLRIYVTGGSGNGPAVYGTGSSWEENVITWGSGRPARTTGVLGDQGAVASGTWMEFDVTSYVTTNGPVSFNIAPTSSDGTDMSSREAATNKPQLVVTTSGSNPPPDDTTAPTVTSVSPVDGATGVATSTAVEATFSEPVQSGSITATSFQLRVAGAPVAAAVSYENATRTATLIPLNVLQANTAYTATVSTEVQDEAGNGLASPHEWVFTTADGSAPPPEGEITRESTSTVENTTASSTVSVPTPSGTSAGDVLVACVTTNGANVAASGVPAGWSSIASVTAESNPRVFGYYRVAGAAEPSTSTWTLSRSVASSAGIARYSGVDAGTPLDAAPTSGSGPAATSATIPGVTTATAGSMLVSCMGANTSVTGFSMTPPDGMAAFWDLGGKRQAAAQVAKATPGPTGGVTWSFSAGRAWAGWLAALRPAG